MQLVGRSRRQKLILASGLLVGACHLAIFDGNKMDRPELETIQLALLELDALVIFLVQQIGRTWLEDAVCARGALIRASQVAFLNVQHRDGAEGHLICLKLADMNLAVFRAVQDVTALPDQHEIAVPATSIVVIACTTYAEGPCHVVLRHNDDRLNANITLELHLVVDRNIVLPVLVVRHEYMPARGTEHVAFHADVMTEVPCWHYFALVHVVEAKGGDGVETRPTPGPSWNSVGVVVHTRNNLIGAGDTIRVIAWEVASQVVEEIATFIGELLMAKVGEQFLRYHHLVF
mmetsp:Transcript_107690/g.229918  ORF Transcript_107690/g.229918 Transcript_107690/m.229918 type:complete len:290 (-) Transcript_107690:285-1154(-)